MRKRRLSVEDSTDFDNDTTELIEEQSDFSRFETLQPDSKPSFNLNLLKEYYESKAHQTIQKRTSCPQQYPLCKSSSAKQIPFSFLSPSLNLKRVKVSLELPKIQPKGDQMVTNFRFMKKQSSKTANSSTMACYYPNVNQSTTPHNHNFGNVKMN
jgi:hypothetical protein